MSRIDSIIDKAHSYLGLVECSVKHREIIDFYNEAKEPSAYKMSVYDPWCAAFVVAVFYACGYRGAVPGWAECNQIINGFKERKKYRVNDGTYQPKAGDVVFFDWNKNGSADHVGIVVSAQAGVINSIEGNYNNTVARRTMKLDDQRIMGYGEPMLDEEPRFWYPYYDLSGSDKTDIDKIPKVKRGSKGVFVKILQMLLNAQDNAGLAVDGVFGAITHVKVREWQTKKRLEVDGVAGKHTWASFFV